MENTMSRKEQINMLKEQISFLEARIGRYEELVAGPAYHRWLFSGKNVWLWIFGCGISLLFMLIFLVHYHAFFWILILICAGIFFYSWVQLAHVRKVNNKERFEKMVISLKKEKGCMDRELARLLAEEAKAAQGMGRQPGKK